MQDVLHGAAGLVHVAAKHGAQYVAYTLWSRIVIVPDPPPPGGGGGGGDVVPQLYAAVKVIAPLVAVNGLGLLVTPSDQWLKLQLP